jgi:hypothetical protein
LLYSSNLPLGVPNWTVIYTITHRHSRRQSSGGCGALLLPGRLWRRGGAVELCPPPRPLLGAGAVLVVVVFFPCVLWRPWWWLDELGFGSRDDGLVQELLSDDY